MSVLQACLAGPRATTGSPPACHRPSAIGLPSDMAEGARGRDAAAPGHAADPSDGQKGELVFLHGTLFARVLRAHDLGRSRVMAQVAAACAPDAGTKASAQRPKAEKVKTNVARGMRFVGKKMINVVRATNHVRLRRLAHETRRAPCCLCRPHPSHRVNRSCMPTKRFCRLQPVQLDASIRRPRKSW